MTVRVATALTDAGRESAVVRVISTMADASVVRRCRDVVELRAVSTVEHIDVVVVDAGLRGFDRDVLADLAASGVRCVVVGDGPQLDERVVTIPADLTGLGDVLRRAPATPVAVVPVADDGARASGRVIAVWGPMGAPGRTTVAIELAVSLSRRGGDVLLVDLDTTGPSIAQLLGLLDDTSGVAAAARLAGDGRLVPDALAGLAVSVPAGPRVLVGLPAIERWTELRPAATEETLRCARQTVAWTVVDVGPGIEGDDLDWVDVDSPRRYGAARAVLATADVLVCVGRTDPVSLTRLLKEFPKASALAPTAAVEVLLNRVCSRATARQAEQLVGQVLGTKPQLVADDPEVERAQLLGVPVRERDEVSPLVEAIDDLAGRISTLFGSYDRRRDQPRRTHRRLLRRADRRHRHRDAGVV